MKYNPESYESRVVLAELITAKLLEWGFGRIEIPGTREHVYARNCGVDLECRVYTTIDGKQVRAKAKDAIRVCLVYVGGEKPRGCGKDRRVHRTGVVGEIVERVKERIDNVTKDIDRCRKCGTPTFRSKKGNDVCAAFCWKQDEATKTEAPKGCRLSDDARKLLVSLVESADMEWGGNEWWRAVPSIERRRVALKELESCGLVTIDRKNKRCQATERGLKSYRKASEAGVLSA